MNVVDNKLYEIYDNCFKQNHSIFLNKHFNLSENGIDYYNKFNIGFEFKESFRKERIVFKLVKKQLELSKYTVFNFNNEIFYMHESIYFLRKYKFKSSNYCYPSKTIIMKNPLFKTKDILKLKKYINKQRF